MFPVTENAINLHYEHVGAHIFHSLIDSVFNYSSVFVFPFTICNTTPATATTTTGNCSHNSFSILTFALEFFAKRMPIAPKEVYSRRFPLAHF